MKINKKLSILALAGLALCGAQLSDAQAAAAKAKVSVNNANTCYDIRRISLIPHLPFACGNYKFYVTYTAVLYNTCTGDCSIVTNSTPETSYSIGNTLDGLPTPAQACYTLGQAYSDADYDRLVRSCDVENADPYPLPPLE